MLDDGRDWIASPGSALVSEVVAIDRGSSVISVREGNAITKTAAEGGVEWRVGLPASEVALGVAADTSGSILVTGQSGSGGNQPSSEAFVRKYSADGGLQWEVVTATRGGSATAGMTVTSDDNENVIVAGVTNGVTGTSLRNLGFGDVFLAKLSSRNGSTLWTRQFGTPQDDFAQGVSTDR